jgi:hypothetical protein
MLTLVDNAGFEFVVSTQSQRQDKLLRAKAIRSHASKAGKARPNVPTLRSWISPNRELGTLARNFVVAEEPPAPESISSVPGPRLVGSYFSGLQLPEGIETSMIHQIGKCRYTQ